MHSKEARAVDTSHSRSSQKSEAAFLFGGHGRYGMCGKNGRESLRRDCGWVAGSFSESHQGLEQCDPMLTSNLWLSHSSRTRAIRSVFLSFSLLPSGHWFFQSACLSLEMGLRLCPNEWCRHSGVTPVTMGGEQSLL